MYETYKAYLATILNNFDTYSICQKKHKYIITCFLSHFVFGYLNVSLTFQPFNIFEIV